MSVWDDSIITPDCKGYYALNALAEAISALDEIDLNQIFALTGAGSLAKSYLTGHLDVDPRAWADKLRELRLVAFGRNIDRDRAAEELCMASLPDKAGGDDCGNDDRRDGWDEKHREMRAGSQKRAGRVATPYCELPKLGEDDLNA